MKNISLILNALLIAAVGYLYYLHFASGKETATAGASDESTVTPISPKDIKASKIVYIDADSLFEKFDYARELKETAESHKTSLEKNYQIKAQSLQTDYMEYQQKGQQGLLSLDQEKNIEENLGKRKAELEGMEDELSRLMDDMQKRNNEIQLDINAFLIEYNKDNNYNYILAYAPLGGNILYASDSLDITNEIVEGLNKRYEEKKLAQGKTKK